MPIELHIKCDRCGSEATTPSVADWDALKELIDDERYEAKSGGYAGIYCDTCVKNYNELRAKLKNERDKKLKEFWDASS